MKFFNLICVLFVFMCNSFDSFAQKSDNIYKPNVWLYDITKIDSLKSKLNFHQELKLGSKNNWYSKNRLKKTNNLFVVFKSESQEPIISILGNNHSFFLQSNSFRLKEDNDLSGYNQSYGELMDFRLGDLGENMFVVNNKLIDVELYEIILDHNLSEFKTNEIRTYLSIKYGIDLIDFKQYVYKDHKQLWSKSSNNNNIFGLAKFSYFNLNQYKSTHSKNTDWTIQFSDDDNIEELKDGDYVLMGDNNKSSKFIKDKNQKLWTIQNNIPTNIDLVWNTESSLDNEFYEYFLILDNKRVEGDVNATQIIFKNIPLASGSHDLTLHRKITDVLIESETSCTSSTIKLQNSSKQLLQNIPYKIFEENGKLISSGNFNNVIEINNTSSRFITIEVLYKTKTYTKKIDLLTSEWNDVKIEKLYVVDDVNPHQISIPKNRFKSIVWLKDNKKVSEESNFKLTAEGNYQLIITSQNDCQREYFFKVMNSQNLNSWEVYPNPASIGEVVTCQFNLKENQKVDLKVYQADGKLVQSFPTFYIKDKSTQSIQLSTSGVYILVAYIDNNLEIKKLIIK